MKRSNLSLAASASHDYFVRITCEWLRGQQLTYQSNLSRMTVPFTNFNQFFRVLKYSVLKNMTVFLSKGKVKAPKTVCEFA